MTGSMAVFVAGDSAHTTIQFENRLAIVSRSLFCHRRDLTTSPLDHFSSIMSRIEKIREMLRDDPSDTFLNYSLAMEHRSIGEHAEALEIFAKLTGGDPPHVQAYFMAGQILVDQGNIDAARDQLRQGIDQARAQDNVHAAAEMSELLASLGAYGEVEDDL